MKKITKNQFSKRLGQYGAMVAAVAGVANAEGQIIYTDIADETVNPGFGLNLDLNNDTIGEFVLAVNGSPYTGVFILGSSINSSSDLISNSNKFLGTVYGPYKYPFNLANGEIISATPSSGQFLSVSGTFNYTPCYAGMEFCDAGGATIEGFIGLEFKIGGNTHYGWARVETNASSLILKDYAYNATAGASILAGQQTLSTTENSLDNTRIVALNKSIGIYNITDSTQYNLYALTGQSVLSGVIKDTTYIIEANTLETGIYILELKDISTNSVIRKKVVL